MPLWLNAFVAILIFVPVYVRDFKCNSIVIRTGGFVEVLEALIELLFFLFFAKHTGKNALYSFKVK